MTEVQLFPLVPNAVLPTPGLAKTRTPIPPGYGVQEHCLPFTAATALARILHEGWMVLPFLLLVMIGMLLRDTLARFFGLPKPAVDVDLSMQACLSGFKA